MWGVGGESMGELQTGMGNAWQEGSASGGKLMEATDRQQMTNHQGVDGRNLEERSLRSGSNQCEGSEPKPEETRMSWTDLCQRGPNGDSKGMLNLHCDTQYLVGMGRGNGNGATRLTAGQH